MQTMPSEPKADDEPCRTKACYGHLSERLRWGGFVVIPVRGKKPFVPSWQNFWTSPPSDKTSAKWSKDSFGENIGLCLGEIIGIDIDHDDRTEADKAQAIAFQVLGQTEFVRVGREPRRTLFYRVSYEDAQNMSGWKIGKVQLLARGSQSVVYGTHPETLLPYVWTDRELVGSSYTDLPLVDLGAVATLREALDQTRLPEGSDPTKAAGQGSGEVFSGSEMPTRGHRNNRLFHHLRKAAKGCPSLEALKHCGLSWNAALHEPLPETEVFATAKQVWSYKEAGTLWDTGKNAPVVVPISRERFASIVPRLKPCAAKLFCLLISTRPSRADFAIAQKATAEAAKMSKSSVQVAIKDLIAHGILEDTGKKHGGSRNWRGKKIYRFGNGSDKRSEPF